MTTFIRDVKIGDVVRLDFMKGCPFNVAVVKNIDDTFVYLYRSYIHTTDFIYTAGVICLQGHEDITVAKSDTSLKISLLERRNPQ